MNAFYSLGLLAALCLSITLLCRPARELEAAAGLLPYFILPLDLDEANAINNRAQIAGARRGHAALWQHGRTRDLGTLPLVGSERGMDPPQSRAVALNNHGLVAGNSGLFTVYPGDVGGGFDSLPFLWGYGRMLLLGTLGGSFGEATAIDEDGAVVGMAEHPMVYDRRADSNRTRREAFLWRRGQMRGLGSLGGEDSVANGINDAGQVVGWSELRPVDRQGVPLARAFLWEKGRIRSLGCLPGFEASSAAAINNRGHVVGELSHDHGAILRAFTWEKGRIRSLSTPAGLSSSALALNDGGQIVGFSRSRSLERRALLWQAGHLFDLNTFLPPGSGWVLNEARAINRQGQIVGVGTFKEVQRGFLLTPRVGRT